MSGAQETGGTAEGAPSPYDGFKPIASNVLVHAISAGPQSLYALAAPGLIAHFGVTTAAFGAMFSLQSGIVAVTSLMVGIFAARINLRLAIIIGAIVHILGNFAAFAIDDWSMFLASRAVVSVADGLMLSCSNAALAGSRNHTRNWGYAIVGIGAFAVAGSFGLPYLIEASGVMYFFAFLALAGVIALPTLAWLPQWTARKAAPDAPRRIFPKLEPAGLLLLVMVTFYTAGMYALIPFSAIIGQNAGWSLAQVGAVKSAAFTVAMIVPFIPIIVGTRLGLGRPLLFVGLAMTSSAFLLGFYPLGIAFVVALIGLEGIVRLGHVYLNSVLARINPAGNLNAAMQAFSGLGGVIGPTAAGLILMAGDYRSVALFSMAMLSIGIGAFIFNGFRLDRAAADQTPSKA